MTDLGLEGLQRAARRARRAPEVVDDPISANIALTETLFWWRSLDDERTGDKAYEDATVCTGLAQPAPGLSAARNTASHQLVEGGRISGEPRLVYPLDYTKGIYRLIYLWSPEVKPDGGHEKLPGGGHEAARWRT